MWRPHLTPRQNVLVVLLPALPATLRADSHVAVVSFADDACVQRKFATREPAREAYIVMQGRFYPGVSVDRSLDGMPFRDIVSFLVPRLQQPTHSTTARARA